MSKSTIYLDNNATTRIDRSVAEAMTAIYAERLANPASQHSEGRRARAILETGRLAIAKGVGCRTLGMAADQVILTSGGTESNNLAIFGLLEGRTGDLVVSSIEHPSVLGAAQAIAERGLRRVRYLPVDSRGQMCLATWSRWLEEHVEAGSRDGSDGRIALLSIMVANNETGVLQPIESIAESARTVGILVHTDAVQAIGKIPFSFAESRVDAMTITAHKLHGPVGIGALVVRAATRINPQLLGGFQQLGVRPGTESVALAVGFATAIGLAVEHIDERSRQIAELRMRLEQSLLSSPRPPTILADDSPRLPHTTLLAYPGIERQALQMALDREGIACSTGSACASGSGQPSHVLQAMHVSESILRGAIRFSLSFETTHSEIAEAGQRILRVVERLTP